MLVFPSYTIDMHLHIESRTYITYTKQHTVLNKLHSESKKVKSVASLFWFKIIRTEIYFCTVSLIYTIC